MDAHELIRFLLISSNAAELVNSLKTHNYDDPFDGQLTERLRRKLLERQDHLKRDGINLAQFLFHLATSSEYDEQERFKKIKETFDQILK